MIEDAASRGENYPRTVAGLMALGDEEATKVLVRKGASVDDAKKLITAYKLEKLYLEAGEHVFLDALMRMFEAQGVKAKLSVQWPAREAMAKRVVAKRKKSR